MITKQQIEKANKSSRSRGCIGKNAVVPRYILEHADKSAEILDFGAGKDAIHTTMLRNEGFLCVTAHEFGSNIVEGVHCPIALDRIYDIVFASNVLNVQSNPTMMHQTIGDIREATKTVFICNYPNSPRYSNLTAKQVEQVLCDYFMKVERVGGTASAPVWECWVRPRLH